MNEEQADKNFAKLIDQHIADTEILREQGQIMEAAGQLSQIITKLEARNRREFKLLLAKALGHRIVCSKHLYQSENLEIYLRGMLRDIEQGLALDITIQDRAVFYLRLGDTHVFLNGLLEAEASYQKAYRAVAKGGYTEAEYLGHLAAVKARLHKYDEAIRLLKNALKIMRRVQELRPFHRLIISSGLRGKLAQAAWFSNRKILALKSFVYAYSAAWWLKVHYGMPQRLNQIHRELNY